MKHNIINGKWIPENGTFVKVPNEQIPEVIQLLRDNGQKVFSSQGSFFNKEDSIICFSKEWYSAMGTEFIADKEIPFPDFKTLVTGKLPEPWCIQCTEESIKHEAWPRFIKSINGSCSLSGDGLGWYYYARPDIMVGTIGAASSWKPNCEVLQIETWAALNPVEETTEKPCTCKPVPADAFPDEPLIRVLKSRGYTISKTY